jgi:hypothetical protein
VSLVAFVWNEKSFLLFCHLDFVVLNLELEKIKNKTVQKTEPGH